MMENRKYSSQERTDISKIKSIDEDGTETLSGGRRNIPQETIQEILLRSPVKSLLKLRCVAKSWLSLISSPQFIKTHVKYSSLDPANYRVMPGFSYDPILDILNHGSDICVCDLLTDVFDDADRLNNPTEWNFQTNDSCNGLLCVNLYSQGREHIFLWNPCLRMTKELPPVTEEKNSGSTYGIGYDESNDDYNVVGLFWYSCQIDAGFQCRVQIYSLKNNSWKRIEGLKNDNIRPCSSSIIYANGKFHFLGYFFMNDEICTGRNIVSLDLENELYGIVEQPESDRLYSDWTIGVLKGCITSLYTYERDYADVWVLKEYGVKESWTKLVRIPYVVAPNISDNLYRYRLILSNGKYLLRRGSRLVVYDPQDNSFVYPQKDNIADISYSMRIYVESLVLLSS